MRLTYSRQRLSQVRDKGTFPHSSEAPRIRWPVEQPHQPQQG
jgi:hypothetical protein